MEKLGVFKIMEDDKLQLCGFYGSKEEAIAYLEYVKTETRLHFALSGEYVCIPMLYFDIQRD
jgi:hypothetical protein